MKFKPLTYRIANYAYKDHWQPKKALRAAGVILSKTGVHK